MVSPSTPYPFPGYRRSVKWLPFQPLAGCEPDILSRLNQDQRSLFSPEAVIPFGWFDIFERNVLCGPGRAAHHIGDHLTSRATPEQSQSGQWFSHF
jgi:hypothetical protein